jgi:Zn-dependent M28 family amino/carboxypeptidase
MRLCVATSLVLAGCAGAQPTISWTTAATRADTVAIASTARALSADSMRGRGPWTADAERAARFLAARLEQLGARPVFDRSLLVPFVAGARPRDTVHNVVGILPNRSGTTSGELVGLTAHLDHLGIGRPDTSGDSIYNGFLDDAIGMALVLDVAARYARSPGSRALAVMFFNLEEQGLLGSKAIVDRTDAGALIERLRLLIGVDAGSPAGEALEWQLMGGSPDHAGTRLADSLARARGWTTTSTPPRAINDVFPFSARGVPILFPIPGRRWRGYTDEQRTAAMQQFDHYHQPSDQWRPDFPWVGTAHFADWLWGIVHGASR